MKCCLYIGLFLPLFVYTSVHGLKCVRPCAKANCRPSLVVLKECEGGLTLGMCGCCATCAKVERELCTLNKNQPPLYGRCDKGLYCRNKLYNGMELDFGICTKSTTGYANTGDVELLSTQRPVASGSGTDDDDDDDDDSEIIIYSPSTQKPTWLERTTMPNTDFTNGEGIDVEKILLPETTNPHYKIVWLTKRTSTFADASGSGSGDDDDSDGEISTGLHTTRKPTVLQKYTTVNLAGSGSGDDQVSKVTTAELPTTPMSFLRKEHTTGSPEEVTTDTEMPPTETSTVDPNIIMFA